jgi:DNA-binding NarL/FixJ family response regulator
MRVLVADDHPMYRYGLRTLLEATPDLEVVGEAATGVEAVSAAATLQPDIVVMDLNMPGLNGIDATRAILRANPGTGVLVLTMFDDNESVFAAMRAGARGYLLKGADKSEIARAVLAVASGEAIFGPAVAQRVIDYFSTARPAGQPPAFPELTEREREILELIAQGHRNPTIAKQLVLSPNTVRNHVSSIFAKLQVADRAQAIIRAREAGLGREQPMLIDR